MKRWIGFTIVMTLGIAALVWSEWHPADTRVTPASLLYFIADSEWELSRLPMAATRLSDQEEIDIGNRLAAHVYEDRFSPRRTPQEKQQIDEVSDYVSRVGASVAARAHRKLPYRFHYIPRMDLVNAFALPGGHVYIGEGLLALMDSEDELAAVLGHEIEHIDHFHCAERVQVEARLRRIPLGELAFLPILIFEAGYSKDQELEADREGAQLAVWAGYSPQGALRINETFDRLFQEYVRRAQSPQEELSQVAIGTLQGYFRSHPLPSERVAQIRRLMDQNHWGNLNHERDLEVAYIFWTERAAGAYERTHYSSAAGLAQHSLEMRPKQRLALTVLGQAQFAQAHFAEAAAAFEQALEQSGLDAELVESYADALAARHLPQQALKEYTAWAEKHAGNWNLAVRLELARLTLAAKGREAADVVLFPAMAPNARSLPPELRGRYGWWFYGLGQYDAAQTWLRSAVQELPGNPRLQTGLGWVLIEQHNLEGAIQRFEAANSRYPGRGFGMPIQNRRLVSERRMGLAVAEWQGKQADEALRQFTSAVYSQPEWRNPPWVEALYSPGVAKSIAEMQAEQEKRNPRRPAGGER